MFLKTYVFPSLCVLGRKYVLGATQSQFRPSRLAMTLRRAQNIYTQEHQLYFYYYHFGAYREDENWKKDNKTVRTITLKSGRILLLVCKMSHNAWQRNDSNYFKALES